VSFGRYAALVVGVVTVSLGGLWPMLAAGNRRAALAGALLAAVNTLGAYALVLWASGRSTSAFMGAVLGGMVGRMGLMLAAVVAAVLFLGLPKVPLAVSLLGYFVVFLVFELTVLQRRTSGAEARRS
jgi:branched-subunit amino acid ABC-type transport system permease component